MFNSWNDDYHGLMESIAREESDQAEWEYYQNQLWELQKSHDNAMLVKTYINDKNKKDGK